MKAINNERDAILRKISSLLSLSDEGDSYEAMTALAKARELIAKYNVELHEIEATEESYKPVANTTDKETAVEFTKQTGIWILMLASTIAKYHGCVVLNHQAYRARRIKITFIGEGDQASLVDAIFHKIVPFVKIKHAAILAKYSNMYSRDYARTIADEYAYGFIKGLEDYYIEQNKNDSSCALMVVIPECVKEKAAQYKESSYPRKTSYAAQVEGREYAQQGYNDGRSYNQKKLNHEKLKLSDS